MDNDSNSPYVRYSMCRHNMRALDCYLCIEFEDDVDVDKCLNCGRYKGSKQLNADQCCKKGCRNPNEY
jgi:hypothetical protein